MAELSLLTGAWLDLELRTTDRTVRFTSTRRAQAVNDGYVQFCELTECLTRQSSVTVSCNTAEYNLAASTTFSTDFVRIAAQGVEYHLTDSNGLLTQLAGDDFLRRDVEWLNRYDAGWRTSTTPQTPTGYYLRMDGGQYILGLDRLPDVGSSEAAQLLVPYVARPAAMTSSTDVPFTAGGQTRTDLYPFHKALVHYAASDLEKLRGDTEASDRQMARFLDYVTRYLQRMRKKGANAVTFTRSYLREAGRTRSGVRGFDAYSRWP